MIKREFLFSILTIFIGTVGILALLEIAARFMVEPLVSQKIQDQAFYYAKKHSLSSPAKQSSPVKSEWPFIGEDCHNYKPANPAMAFSPRTFPALGMNLTQEDIKSAYSQDSIRLGNFLPVASQPESKTKLIAFFGPSLVAGDGIPCFAFFLPSQFQRKFALAASRNQSITSYPRVDNLGQSGYVMHNQILLLLSQLRHGYRPDLVLFYPGHNDALQSVMQASAHFNYRGVAVGTAGTITLRYALRDSFLSRSSLARLITGTTPTINGHIIEGKDGYPALYTGSFAELIDPKNLEKRAEIIVDGIVRDVQFIAALGQQFGFSVVIAAAPSVFDRQNPFHTEARILEARREQTPEYEQSITVYQNRLKKAFDTPEEGVTFFDLRGCTREAEENIFIDFTHMTEFGYGMMAECLYSKITPLLQQN